MGSQGKSHADRLQINFMACLVPFCCRDCLVLPDDAEVFRVGSDLECEVCGKKFYQHPTFAYPSGMRHVFLDCNGVFVHT